MTDSQIPDRFCAAEIHAREEYIRGRPPRLPVLPPEERTERQQELLDEISFCEQTEVLPTCEELGIGFVPFSPLGRGFLTGKMDEKTSFAQGDVRNRYPRFSPEARSANQPLVQSAHLNRGGKESTARPDRTEYRPGNIRRLSRRRRRQDRG